MKKLSKNKIKKLRRGYNPKPYYDYLINLFLYSEDNRRFIDEINYSLLSDKRNLTRELVWHAKSHDPETARLIEGAVTDIVNGLAREHKAGQISYTEQEKSLLKQAERKRIGSRH